MAQTTRQTNLLVNQDWTKVYQSFTNADFTSYDFETLRNSMINYLKTYYPESFNDFLESSEYLALIDMVAFLGQSLSFRTDLNARENFLDTAQRRDSILKLARMLSYNPTRTQSASGLLKIESVATTESVIDSNGINLANTNITWNDLTNTNWLEQFTTILNATLNVGQAIGKPGNSQMINGIQTDEYSISLDSNSLPVAAFKVPINSATTAFEAVSATSVGQSYIYENTPVAVNKFNILYRNDNNGNASNNTGFFVYFKQGSLQATNFTIQNAIPNNIVPINTNNINNSDGWLYGLNVAGGIQTIWDAVPTLSGLNVIYNQQSNKNLYQVSTRNGDQVSLVFGDGSFSTIPQGGFRYYYRTGNGLSYSITPDDISGVTILFQYISASGSIETLTVTASLKYTVTNATATQSLQSIKTYAPQQYYTQNRMITGEDYNIFPLTTFTSIQKVKAVNRSSSGVSPYLDSLDPTGSFSSTNIFCSDGNIAADATGGSSTFSFLTTNDIYSAIYNDILPVVSSTEMINYYYANYPRYTPTNSNIKFVQTSSTTASSYGNLTYNGNVIHVGNIASGNLKYVNAGASVQFLTNANANATSFYSSVTNIVSNTETYFGMVVPTGSIVKTIIPSFKNDFSTALISTIATQIAAKVSFGLTYDQVNQVWVNIPPANIGTTPSSGWLLKFTYNAGLYNVQYKKLTYTFASAGETKFYFDTSVKVYDSALGTTISDIVKILKINTKPNDTVALTSDVMWDIYNVITSPDGYVDGTTVLVKAPDMQLAGVPDNPDLYKTVANVATSRSDLYFQYKHNSPSRSRIDPTPVNIVDLYILTAEYATGYINWLRDTTGVLDEPMAPTTSSLEIAYSKLDSYKTVSDSIIYNSAKFKPLFGAKADPSLQARFQVVINPAVSITPNEAKTQVINAINAYFDLSHWDFGDSFYFSELAAYLHTTLVPNIASVLIVPVDDTLVFGNHFQINAEPWEIITSCATVDNVDIISAVTAAQLNLGNNLVGTY
jgi:hypothetical protein